jgi:hypothetical protein
MNSSACLPTLRLLLVKLFPILGGSTMRSRQQYYKYGSNNELRDIPRSGNSRAHKSVGTSSTIRSPERAAFPHEDVGITVKTSYTVERSLSDTDEASLVSHEDEKKGRMK